VLSPKEFECCLCPYDSHVRYSEMRIASLVDVQPGVRYNFWHWSSTHVNIIICSRG